ncbi:hypothetical protein LSCM4_04575 [Leishmania orientalis]|uniref:Uncharacterized protein n=1 Tax=Leishmania orientalis TaxID=2249476 RepID=A0A836HGD7_9TRYP|nr:hypothetical protein LSCM4_04575 [Leishmania orientalis]
MEVDQHIAATISEIDRTLRFLGIRDEYSRTLPQSSIVSSPPAFMSAMVARTDGTAQTSSSSRLSSGVQKSCSTASQGMQHSPQQRTTSCQTEKGTNTQEHLAKLATSVRCTYAILEEKFQALESSAGKIEALFVKLARTKGKASSSATTFHLLQNRWSMVIIEKEEMSARSAVLSAESDARTQLTSLRCGELVRLVAAFTKEEVQSKPSSELKRVVQTPVMANAKARKGTASSSLDDLTELLDECWRVLDD